MYLLGGSSMMYVCVSRYNFACCSLKPLLQGPWEEPPPNPNYNTEWIHRHIVLLLLRECFFLVILPNLLHNTSPNSYTLLSPPPPPLLLFTKIKQIKKNSNSNSKRFKFVTHRKPSRMMEKKETARLSTEPEPELSTFLDTHTLSDY